MLNGRSCEESHATYFNFKEEKIHFQKILN